MKIRYNPARNVRIIHRRAPRNADRCQNTSPRTLDTFSSVHLNVLSRMPPNSTTSRTLTTVKIPSRLTSTTTHLLRNVRRVYYHTNNSLARHNQANLHLMCDHGKHTGERTGNVTTARVRCRTSGNENAPTLASTSIATTSCLSATVGWLR
jgi:hypothetical protein